DPLTEHECGDSRYLAVPYFDFWLEQRLPPIDAVHASLRPIGSARELWQTAMADKLDQYVRTGGVADDTRPPAPRIVTAERNDDGSVAITWEAAADLESGVRCFMIERNGELIGQVPETPAGRYGRPLFQGLSYHDTPESPLPRMEFVDLSAPAGALPEYAVRTVNSRQLKSSPTRAPNAAIP
ncbi:MAG: hypothetical protein AAF961_04440, partial [Planctomycetota bacterium]